MPAIQRDLIPEVMPFLLAHPSITQDQQLVSTLLCTSKALSSNLAGQVHVDFTTKSSRRTQAFAAWLVKNSWAVQTLKVDLNIACCSEDAEIASNAVVAALQAASATARTASSASAAGTAAAPPAAAAGTASASAAPLPAAGTTALAAGTATPAAGTATPAAGTAASAAGTAAAADKATFGPALLYYRDTALPSAAAALLSRLSCCSHHIKQLGLVDINEEVLAQLPRGVEVLVLSNCSASAQLLLQLKEKLPHLKELHLTYQPCVKPMTSWPEGVLDEDGEHEYPERTEPWEKEEEQLILAIQRSLPALPALPVTCLVVSGNKLVWEDVRLDFEQVGKLTGLKRLILADCTIKSRPAAIPAVLGKCRKLQEVELRGIYISYGPRPLERTTDPHKEAEKVVMEALDELPQMLKKHVDLVPTCHWR